MHGHAQLAPAVARVVEDVERDRDPARRDADLGQDAGLGHRREASALDGRRPHQAALGVAVGVPVPVLREPRALRALAAPDGRALGEREQLGARVERADQLGLEPGARAQTPRAPPRAVGASSPRARARAHRSAARHRGRAHRSRTAAGTRPGNAQRAPPGRNRRRDLVPADPSRPCSASSAPYRRARPCGQGREVAQRQVALAASVIWPLPGRPAANLPRIAQCLQTPRS